MNQKFRTSLVIPGITFFVLGSIQGLGLSGIGEEPVVQGILGGLFPVLAGWLGGCAFSTAFGDDAKI